MRALLTANRIPGTNRRWPTGSRGCFRRFRGY